MSPCSPCILCLVAPSLTFGCVGGGYGASSLSPCSIRVEKILLRRETPSLQAATSVIAVVCPVKVVPPSVRESRRECTADGPIEEGVGDAVADHEQVDAGSGDALSGFRTGMLIYTSPFFDPPCPSWEHHLPHGRMCHSALTHLCLFASLFIVLMCPG